MIFLKTFKNSLTTTSYRENDQVCILIPLFGHPTSVGQSGIPTMHSFVLYYNQLYISCWLIDFFLTMSRACGVRGLWQAADPGGAQSNSDNASSTTTSAYATSQKSPTETYRRAAYIARWRYFGSYVWFACRNSLVLRRFIYCYVISVLQSNTSFLCFTNNSKINTFAFF